MASPVRAGIIPGSNSDRGPVAMAKSQFKAGGPTRGRKRTRLMGMGSGKTIAKIRAKKKR